jgi:ABC-type Fe3+/spermidine/putrescine transport system ATPase subunit
MITVRNLQKFYGPVRGIDDISCTCSPGMHILIGLSGSGKTTFLRLLAGLETPTGGSIEWNGLCLSSDNRIHVPPPDRQIMMVAQEPSLWPNMTSLGNVVTVLRGRGLSRTDAKEQAAYFLDLAGAIHLAARYPHELSGGQARSVEIARALAVESPVLLLDEPFSGIDISASLSMAKRLERIMFERGMTILMSTHSPALLQECDSRVLLFENGRIAADGSVSAIQTTLHSSFIRAMGGQPDTTPGVNGEW